MHMHKSLYHFPLSSEETLKTFSNTRIMKLLYCLCLESYGTGNKEYGETPKPTDNLFGFFGRFTALPNGPVLLSLYRELDIVPGFVYKDGHYLCEKIDNVSDVLYSEHPYAVVMVDNAICELHKHMDSELFKDRNKLIELMFKLPIWQDTFMYRIDKLMSIDSYDIKREYSAYIKCLEMNKIGG